MVFGVDLLPPLVVLLVLAVMSHFFGYHTAILTSIPVATFLLTVKYLKIRVATILTMASATACVVLVVTLGENEYVFTSLTAVLLATTIVAATTPPMDIEKALKNGSAKSTRER